MLLHTRLPSALAACLFLLILAATQIAAQTEITEAARPRRASVTTSNNGASVLSTDPIIISVAEEIAPSVAYSERPKFPSFLPASPSMHMDEMLLAAIDLRIGSPYVWGANGPHTFDCSGFVWSVFQSAGISFERTNARTLWARLSPARPDERYRFGTLVFFNNLQHVGIVADERGFYHASRSQGVTYSTFDGYWGERVDGFRSMGQSLLAE